MPIAVAGLFDDSTTFPDIGKLFSDATKQASACDLTVMPPETPFIRAVELGSGKPLPSPPYPPVVPSGSTAIPAPVPAA